MKFSKFAIILIASVFLVFCVSIANLAICMSTGEQLVFAWGLLIVMFGVFVATVITAIKDAKKSASADDDDDDDDDDDNFDDID